MIIIAVLAVNHFKLPPYWFQIPVCGFGSYRNDVHSNLSKIRDCFAVKRKRLAMTWKGSRDKFHDEAILFFKN